MSFAAGTSGLTPSNTVHGSASNPPLPAASSGTSSSAPSRSLADWGDLNASLVATETEPAPHTNDCIHLLPELEAGTVLVGNPKHTCNGEPHLHHAVVLVLGYDPDYGTIAVALNCSHETELPMPPVELTNVPFRVGGECPSDEVVCLYRTPEGLRDFPGTFMKGLSFIFGFGSILHAVTYGKVDKETMRMYHARQDWGQGELEKEVNKGYWCIAAVSCDYVFDLKPREIYQCLVRELHLG